MTQADRELEKLASLGVGALQQELARLRERPPSAERDALLGMALLRLALQVSPNEAAGYFLSGYSYARTSRHPRVRQLAEEVRPRFDE